MGLWSKSKTIEIYNHAYYTTIGLRDYLSEDKVKRYMWQLIKSMDYMHRYEIVYVSL